MTRSKTNGFESVSFVKLPGDDYIVARAERSVPVGGRYLKHNGFDLHYVTDYKTLRGPMSEWGPAVMSCKGTDSVSMKDLLDNGVKALKMGSFPIKPRVSMERKPILHHPAHFLEEMRPIEVSAPRSAPTLTANHCIGNGLSYDDILRTNNVEAAIQMMSELRLRPASDWQETFRLQDGLSRIIGNRNPVTPGDSVSQIESPRVRREPTAPAPTTSPRAQPMAAPRRERNGSVSSLPPYTEQLPRGEARVGIGPDIEVAQAIGEPVNRRPDPVDRGSNPGNRAGPASVAGSVQSSRSSTISVSRSLIANLVARGGPNGLSARDRASLRESLRTGGGSPIGPALERIHEDPNQADSGRPSAYRSVDSSGSFMF